MAKQKLSKKAVVESLEEALGPGSPAVDMIIKDSEERNKHKHEKKNQKKTDKT
jgi:hypothetical protein